MEWQDKTEVKKGNIGEDICRQLQEKEGYVVYKALTNKAHLIDFFCHKEKNNLRAVEVKTKRRTLKSYWYKSDESMPYFQIGIPGTGFDLKHAKEYYTLYKKHNIDILIYFVDDFEACIYGGWFSKLIPFAKKMQTSEQVVFPLSEMEVFYKLTPEQCEEISYYTNSSYDYSTTERYFSVA